MTTTAATDSQPAPNPRKERYPPIVVESFPNFSKHLRAIKEKLGRTPTVRPFNQGVRFTPADGDEYRVVQAYLTSLDETHRMTWFSYSLPKERSLKLAIRGLPADTRPEDIKEELEELGFEPEHVKKIAARMGRPGCIFFAAMKRTANLTPDIYEVDELLCMPGVKIESWRGRKGPAQCHRCQAFRHSSHNCFRRLACVRCGGEHYAHDCPRPLDEPATCANCGGAHTANNPRCAVFREEARNRRAGTTALTRADPPECPLKKTTAQAMTPTVTTERSSPTSLMAAANPPPPRGAGQMGTKKKKKKKRKKKKTQGSRKVAPLTNAPSDDDIIPLVRAPRAQTEGQRRHHTPVPLPRASETDKKTSRTKAELEIIELALSTLQDVLQALREGADPIPLLLAGVGKLLSCR